MTIARLSPADVADVAALHGESLRGLLTRLGPRATRAYYAASATSRLAIGFVARGSDGGLEGFVLGSRNPTELRREVLGRDPIRMLAAVAVGVMRRPGNLQWLMKANRGPDSGHYDAAVPELIYLAVSPMRRGSGVGHQLVESFTNAMRIAGHSRYELSVDADNLDAARFYERLGFERVGEYDEFGIRHVRYALALGTSPR